MMRTLLLPARALALIVAVWAVAAPTDCVAGTCRPGELFNYFTIHSAALLILAVLLAMVHTLRAGGQPPWLTTLRALATTYMMVSGAVFAAMVTHAERFGHSLSVPLSSTVLHFVLPVYALADFLMDPQRHRLRWATAWLALIFPTLWGVYTMARGQLVDWYPYFFLDPYEAGGYRAVGLYVLGLFALIVLTTVLVVAISRRLPMAAPSGPTHPTQSSSQLSSTCESKNGPHHSPACP